MKLPRWLSPVRTVEAETGWPRAVCRRFASHLEHRFLWKYLAVWGAIAAVLGVAWGRSMSPLLRFAFGLEGPPWPPLVTVAVACFVIPAIFLGVPGVLLYNRLTLKMLSVFCAAPWCLKCRYPAPPAPEDESTVCPECGEPIPPEIARLVAERKADTA